MDREPAHPDQRPDEHPEGYRYAYGEGEPEHQILSAGALIGNHVKNAEGENLGRIEQLMIDVAEGRISYAVMSFGGFLGLRDRLLAIPWSALTLNPDGKTFRLNIDRKLLESAPSFERDKPPEVRPGVVKRQWIAGVYTHYGYEPYWDFTKPG